MNFPKRNNSPIVGRGLADKRCQTGRKSLAALPQEGASPARRKAAPAHRPSPGPVDNRQAETRLIAPAPRDGSPPDLTRCACPMVKIFSNGKTGKASFRYPSPIPTKAIAMLVFLDTEFTDFIDCELISIGLVAEDGREFYGELTDFAPEKCSDFVRAAVLPKLGKVPAVGGTEAEVGAALKAWLADLGEPIHVCVDYSGDWELFTYLVRDPETLAVPAHITCRNINSQLSELDIERFWMENGRNDHHALYDARANKYAFENHTVVESPKGFWAQLPRLD